MLTRLFTIELNLNTSNKLVSLSSAIIFALLFIIANELLYWDLAGVEFAIVCVTLGLTGYVFAEIAPATAKALPFIVGLIVVLLLLVSLVKQSLIKHEETQLSNAFFAQNNFCEGHALVNKNSWPACVKMNSQTIRTKCRHLKGNEFDCFSIAGNDVISRPQWVSEKLSASDSLD